MLLKQIALTQEENDILYDLVHHELRHANVYGTNPDIIDVTRLLLGLYDQLDKFEPPKKLRKIETEKKEVRPKDTGNESPRRARQRDLQEEE